MQRYAILIDGGFAKRKLGPTQAPATAKDFQTLVEQLRTTAPLDQMRLHRVYYYDSVPLETEHKNPLSGEAIKFGASKTAIKAHQLFEALSQQPFTALRLGELEFKGWNVTSRALDKAASNTVQISSADLKPHISQKGVDMRIGMDIASLTLKKQVQAIVLVSGDSDFVPAMKFARREGANIFLVPLGHHVKHAMLEHCDLILKINHAGHG